MQDMGFEFVQEGGEAVKGAEVPEAAGVEAVGLDAVVAEFVGDGAVGGEAGDVDVEKFWIIVIGCSLTI